MKRKVSVNISWLATPGDQYKLLWGTSSSNLSNVIDVGSASSYRISGLTANRTYYFAMKARNNNGESPMSKVYAYTTGNRKNELTL